MNASGGRVLRRSLSRRDLIVYGLLFIGPLAPVGVFGVLDARTSGAVALVYLCATIAMALTAWSYAQMSAAATSAPAKIVGGVWLAAGLIVAFAQRSDAGLDAGV
jgi:amino acid transporter